jgi:hypothetical protein
VNDATYCQSYVTIQGISRHTFDKIIILLNHMGNLLYIIAVILIIAWAIGFFAYSVGGIIHILLVIAIIAIILRVIQGK